MINNNNNSDKQYDYNKQCQHQQHIQLTTFLFVLILFRCLVNSWRFFVLANTHMNHTHQTCVSDTDNDNTYKYNNSIVVV